MNELIEHSKNTRNYSLLGIESKLAIEKGLAGAEWYQCYVPKQEMRKLLTRKNNPAIRDTILWFALIFGSGIAFYMLWGTALAFFPYIIYSVLYASTSDSRWHESSHGTAFKDDWMNNVLYEISSFMVFRQSITWKWSHVRHHSDTIIRGRDPEIVVPRPPDIPGMILQLFALKSTPSEFKKIVLHAFGKIDPEVATYVPKVDYNKVFFRARIYLLIYAAVVALALYTGSWLPLFFIGLPTFFGSWLMVVYGTTQHAGLEENVLDHRLNCRTVYMNRINRYLYWNMNYHLEHHMFPLVPYHALPKLHKLIKKDTPKPYSSIKDAYEEIIPTIIKQTKDPSYHAKRILPEPSINKTNDHLVGDIDSVHAGWVEVCSADALHTGDVIRYDLKDETFAIYRTANGSLYATEGICTHGRTHLSDGLIIGDQIECPKHNGRFSLTDGSVKRPPVCLRLKTFKVKEEQGVIFLKVDEEKDQIKEEVLEMTVVSNDFITPLIKELTLKSKKSISYHPGDYVRFVIPPYVGGLDEVEVPAKFSAIWKEKGVHDFKVSNRKTIKRNYSLSTNPSKDELLKFTIRLALPSKGSQYAVGIGSTYVFRLKVGDKVDILPPMGHFRIKNEKKELVYIGGGAGMAPLRSHISNLLETRNETKKISFWYGARTELDTFYDDYFHYLESEYPNFKYYLALSDIKTPVDSNFKIGFIHQVVFDNYLKNHEEIHSVEFYLCGPPPMVEASRKMLKGLGVNDNQILSDDF